LPFIVHTILNSLKFDDNAIQVDATIVMNYTEIN